MANIYNETMLYLYNKGELYKSKWSDMGKIGFWSKNCTYGYAHYKPEPQEFYCTLGWKGIEQINKKFGKVFNQYYKKDEKAYFDFMEYHNIKWDWIYTINGNELRKFYKQIKPYIMLIKI